MFYTVAIPHQHRVKVTEFEDLAEFISSVYESDSSFNYSEMDRNDLAHAYGPEFYEDGEPNEDYYLTARPELAPILAAHATVYEVCTNGQSSSYYAPGTQPSEFDAACEAAGRDLEDFKTFDSAEELAAWAGIYGGHQCDAVRTEVSNLLAPVATEEI